MDEAQTNKIEMKYPTSGKVGRPIIGEVAMTSTERSRRYRKEGTSRRRHTSFDLATSAHQELLRTANKAGVSATGALLAGIHLISQMDSDELATLVKTVAKLHGQRIAFSAEVGQASRVPIGGYGS